MNRFARIASIALGAGLVSAAPAAADYSIDTDVAYPSVVFIEFDPDTIPMVYTAPGGGGMAIPVIGDGAVTDGSGSADDMAPAAQDSGTTTDNQTTSASVNQRANEKVKDLMNSSPAEIEDMIINRKIEDQVLKDANLPQ